MIAKSVIEALPIYSMVTNKIPWGIINNIKKDERSFIWEDQVGRKKMHAIGWNLMARPKAYGGVAM